MHACLNFFSLIFFSGSPWLSLKETMRPFYKFHIPFSLRRSTHTYQSYSNFPPAGIIPSAAGWESPPRMCTHTHPLPPPPRLTPTLTSPAHQRVFAPSDFSFFLSFFFVLHPSSVFKPPAGYGPHSHSRACCQSEVWQPPRFGNPPPKTLSFEVLELWWKTLNKVLRFNWTFSDVGPIPLGINRFNIM